MFYILFGGKMLPRTLKIKSAACIYYVISMGIMYYFIFTLVNHTYYELQNDKLRFLLKEMVYIHIPYDVCLKKVGRQTGYLEFKLLL